MLILKRYVVIALLIQLLNPTPLHSQKSVLELSKIMGGDDFIGHQPSTQTWAPNSKDFFFKWQKSDSNIETYFTYNINNKKLNQLSFDKNSPTPLNGFTFTTDENSYYFKSGKSIYQNNGGVLKKVYSSSISFSLLDVINDELLIRQTDNIIAIHTTKGTFTQITHFKKETAPTEVKEETNYLQEQQEALFETVRNTKSKQAAQKEYKSSLTPDFLSPFYLDNWNLDDIQIAENKAYGVFIKSKYPNNKATDFIQQVTSNGYAKAKKARSKVGASNPEHSVFIWDFENDTTIEVDFSALTSRKLLPSYYKNYPENQPTDYTKEITMHLHGINKTNDKCLVEIKSYDNKDRWIGFIDLMNGKFTELNHQHDEEWIGGPGISGWNMAPGNIGWLKDDCIYYQSEKSGYSHLYMLNCETKKTEQLTKGDYEIHKATLSKDQNSFYISANKNHPGNREFYKLNISSKKLTPILTKDGNHEVSISPDEKWLLVKYSYKNKPWEIYVAPNKENTTLEQITHSTREAFNNYPWRAPEVITFKASDNQAVNARIYTPTPENKNGAAVFFVHGAGYLQNAHNWWSGYHREYMFNNLLCDMGFTVMDIDYRASKGYGKSFRTDIYRHMGGKDLSDYVDARSYLMDEFDIDSNRIGIYGGSYGGFITIMALLTEPGKFKCGAAVRSVTDWAHYNHPYTSNILNTPSEDPIAFKQSSPIYFAENLSDRLLILHGMVDDNVQYQDVARLSQRFIELGKKNWDLVGYPIEPHGFKETSSWTDEYGRILKMFQEELLEK